MRRIAAHVRAHRFSLFVGLTFVFTWIPWLLVVSLLRTGGRAEVTTLILVGGFGPFLAASVVAAAGGDGLSWVLNLLDFRARLTVWAAAIVLPVVLYLSALAGYVLAGGDIDPAGILPWSAVTSIAVASFIRGGLEEPGWRGLGQPVLQQRYGAFRASFLLGVIWAVWHVPLFLMPGSAQAGSPFWLYLPTVIGISVITAWLYNMAGGRVLIPVVFHTLSNTVSVSTAMAVVGDGHASGMALMVVVWVAVVAIVLRYGPRRLADRPLPSGGLSL